MSTRTPLNLTDVERDELRALVRAPRTPRALADRCRVVLLDAQGLTYAQIGAKIDMREQTVLKWRGRFLTHRLAGLRDRPRPGIKRTITDEMVAAVVRRTLQEKPPDATHWSTRSMAAATGISRTSINGIWRAFNLQPHRSETFKLSTDPRFVEKVRDIVGLYMSPPQNAVVICVDEKSQMQALDRTQPLLPLRPGTPERRTHDYRRHGTSSLFAGLMVKTGVVIRECHRRHRHQEFIRFLRTIDEVVKATEPRGTQVHIVLDNYATHKTPAVQRWIARHPEYRLHFTPTSAIRTLKRARPSAFILLGGHHAAASADDLLRDVPEIDAVCGTGGESVIADLVRAFRTGTEALSKGRRVLRGAEVEDLDRLPIPRPPSVGTVARACTSRGCPFKCSFCTTPGMRKLWNEPTYRSRSPESVVTEFERLYEQGFIDIRVNDDLFIVPSPESRQRAIRIAELVTARKLPIRYKVEYRCDSIPVNGVTFLRTLRASGLREVFLGVESGSKRILQEYRKSLVFNTSVAAVRMHAEAGIVINAGNILASPDSTTEDIVQSIEGFAALGLAYLLFRRTNFRAHVVPGTGMEESLRRSGRLVGATRYGQLSYAFAERRIEDVVNLLEAAMPGFLVRTRGEMFIGRKAALHALYDGVIEQDSVLPILAEMNEGSTAFLLRWFRDLPPAEVTEARLASEMDEFIERCCRWGRQLTRAGAPTLRPSGDESGPSFPVCS